MLELLQYMEDSLVRAMDQRLLLPYYPVSGEGSYLRQGMGVLTPPLCPFHLAIDLTDALICGPFKSSAWGQLVADGACGPMSQCAETLELQRRTVAQSSEIPPTGVEPASHTDQRLVKRLEIPDEHGEVVISPAGIAWQGLDLEMGIVLAFRPHTLRRVELHSQS